MDKGQYLSRAAAIAATYAVVTYMLKPISYGNLQIRVSETLTLLPLLESAAVPGLFLGCLIANLLGGLGPWDVYGGSIITLIAAYLTSKVGNPFVGAIFPIILNSLGVPLYLSKIYDLPYWVTALSIGAGEFISVGLLGIPLYYAIKKSRLGQILNKKNKR